MSSSEQRSVVPMNPTDVTEVTWGIYQPGSTNMGIIKLDSFNPGDTVTKSLAVIKAIMIICLLLDNGPSNTNLVMYDLRGNSGGSVGFTNRMVQLFKPDFKPFGDCYLMNQITYSSFVAGQDPNAYLRPMGVLNDARCYSACEVFSGAIQGHSDGTIFGEDDLQKFPSSQELASGSTTYTNALSVGVTQTIRIGRYSDRDIENLGIETDTIVRPWWSDLHPNSTTNTQSYRIAARLARTGRKNGQSKLHFVSEPFAIVRPPLSNSHWMLRPLISTPEFNFAGISDSAGLYQPSTTASGNGWSNLKGSWVIGNGGKYVNSIDSFTEAFFTAPIGTNINIGLDVTLDTELGFDFLYLSVKSSGNAENFLLSSKSRDGTKTFNGISGRA
ncbi:hypothetical protein BASA60_008009 [Batrachochytrium salamandrivorans]|nr:hypothetical protein BASA60_008009 [Batrachochytrium salamandrivorans]